MIKTCRIIKNDESKGFLIKIYTYNDEKTKPNIFWKLYDISRLNILIQEYIFLSGIPNIFVVDFLNRYLFILFTLRRKV